jgi:hypothetical protein
MARETLKITKVTSDLSGEEGADTLTFTVNGTGYAIDLTETETKEFHDMLAPYVTRAQVRPKRGGAVGKKSTPEELAAIREWAAKNGHDISPTARIPAAVRKAYDAAQGSKPAKKAPAKKATAK